MSWRSELRSVLARDSTAWHTPRLNFTELLLVVALLVLVWMGCTVATSSHLDAASEWFAEHWLTWVDTMRYAWWHV